MGTIEIILTVISGVFGTGWAAQALYFRYERRKRETEAKTAEIDVDAREDEIRNKKLIDAYDTIVKTQELLNKERDMRMELFSDNTDLKLQLAQAKEQIILVEFARCDKESCGHRTPPRVLNADKLMIKVKKDNDADI